MSRNKILSRRIAASTTLAKKGKFGNIQDYNKKSIFEIKNISSIKNPVINGFC